MTSQVRVTKINHRRENVKLLFIAAALALSTPAWAINKCAGIDGHVVFQDKPCPGQGETVGEELARREKERKLAMEQQKQADARAEIEARSRISRPQSSALPEESDSGGAYFGRRYGRGRRR